MNIHSDADSQILTLSSATEMQNCSASLKQFYVTLWPSNLEGRQQVDLPGESCPVGSVRQSPLKHCLEIGIHPDMLNLPASSSLAFLTSPNASLPSNWCAKDLVRWAVLSLSVKRMAPAPHLAPLAPACRQLCKNESTCNRKEAMS